MTETNPNSRLEAFCDGVFAIALTLLIIDIKIPATTHISNTPEFWMALKHIVPGIGAFLLSFIVVLITWANHHATLKLINKSSHLFLYTNAFLLLTMVFIPFPTALLGEHILTDHAAPAVILYNTVLALSAVGWVLLTRVTLKGRLYKNEKVVKSIRRNGQFGFMAFLIYTVAAVLAIWFPLTMAGITTITWLFWLAYGITVKEEE